MHSRIRHYDAKRDLRRLCELAQTSSERTLHAGDVQLKLSDPALCLERDVCVVENDGEILGFAFVQPSCCDLSFAVKQGARRPEIEVLMMAWAMARFNEIADERGRLTFFFTSVHEDDRERMSLLERYGFVALETCYVYLHRPLDISIPKPRLPEGFTLRHIAGAHELRAYVAAHRNAFWMENYTEAWHKRVCEMPYYVPELDLVVVAPDGTFAAFCLSWLERGECAEKGLTEGYIQTLGTHLKFQNRGFGRALFLESLRRMRSLGADRTVGQVEGGNEMSLRMAESAGARPHHKIYRYCWKSGGV